MLKTSKEIAQELGLTQRTCQNHLKRAGIVAVKQERRGNVQASLYRADTPARLKVWLSKNPPKVGRPRLYPKPEVKP